MDISTPMKKVCTHLLLLSVTYLGSGCRGISTRPDGRPGPQDCPSGALEAMQRLGLAVSDRRSIRIDPRSERNPLVLLEGPIESLLEGDFGALPAGTRFYGQVWTGGPDVVIRYHEVRTPHGRTYPFCGIAVDGSNGMTKRPDSPPGSGIIPDGAAIIRVVDAFR